ncbi:MAG: extracellular solute-binding protein [Anaerolineae bacterium]
MSRKLSRRDFLRVSALGTAGLLISCQQATEEPEIAQDEPVPGIEEEEAVEEEAQETPKSIEELMREAGAEMPGSPDHPRGWRTDLPDLPMGYPLQETIEISTSRRVDAGTKFMEGDDLENNPWSRMIEALFGIKFTVAWTWSSADESNQKYNLAMASGDMPDIMETIPAPIFVKMVEADLLMDLGSVWDAHASARWKEAFAQWGDLAWVRSKINGVRWGLPRVEIAGQDDTCLWVRQDWLDRLGLQIPTTLDELYDVANAFVDEDIGSGAEGTTVGLLANQSFANSWYGSLDPFWGTYGLTTNWSTFGWSEDGDGNLRWDGIRPEAKDCLELLHTWYVDGLIRSDFYTLPTSECITDLAAGNCGMHFTPSWGANRDAVTNDPECEWVFADIPAGPTGKHKHTGNPLNNDVFACPKDFEYAKEWIELTNWRIPKREDVERRMHGWEGADYGFDEEGKLTDPGIYYDFMTVGPLGTRGGGWSDPAAYGNMIKYRLEEWGAIPPEERDAMQEATFEDPLNVLSDQARLFLSEVNAEQGLVNMFQGLPTPTMVERGADLDSMLGETVLSIINGQLDLDAFDSFVEQWKELGGDQITEEVNQWWAEQQS